MSGENILVVDDDSTTAKVMQLYIKDCGYNVAGTAFSGKEAIDLCRELAPDLVLMDIFLGKGLSGIDAAEIIQRHFDIPVVFVTSHAEQNTLERAKATKPAGYINKPLRQTDIKTTLELIFARLKPADKNAIKSRTSINELLMSVYSLSRSEAKVAAKLLEYPDLNYVADSLNISISTARTHLKRIYRKTETNRQSVLIHKIVTGPVGLLLDRSNPDRTKVD